MHDPVDQPSIQPSSGTPSAGGEPDCATQTTAISSHAMPLIRLDQSPAIEPEKGLDHGIDDRVICQESCEESCAKTPLVTPTMWR
mgnify:CR=1 FL=1